MKIGDAKDREVPFRRILVLLDRDSDTGESICGGLESLGIDHTSVSRFGDLSDVGSPDTDLVLGYGPHNGTMMMLEPLVESLRARGARPVVVWWLLENLPQFGGKVPGAGLLAATRVSLDRWIGGGPERASRLHVGQRWRILGELLQLRRKGFIDRVVVASTPRRQYLERFGIESAVVPMGFHPTFGTMLNRQRDIDVAFLGQATASRRRTRLLRGLRDSLARAGVTLDIASNLHDVARTEYLNRVRILVNVLKAPTDSVGHRLLLAAANGCVLVSEPMRDVEAFVAGRHFVESPIAEMVAAIRYLLEREPERRRIASEVSRYVRKERTIESALRRIFAHAETSLQERQSQSRLTGTPFLSESRGIDRGLL